MEGPPKENPYHGRTFIFLQVSKYPCFSEGNLEPPDSIAILNNNRLALEKRPLVQTIIKRIHSLISPCAVMVRKKLVAEFVAALPIEEPMVSTDHLQALIDQSICEPSAIPHHYRAIPLTLASSLVTGYYSIGFIIASDLAYPEAGQVSVHGYPPLVWGQSKMV